MAAELHFGDEDLLVLKVVDILAKEVNRFKRKYSKSNESLQVEQRNVTETSNGNLSDDMNLMLLANTM